ncbi:serine hydrolase domain-containing protein [Umezawaea sp. Da 62-37]|nr:serine hydrolase domain-containing protein [Umezawaea sp. Da 62-37]WNV91963.1 serine hydrolase domain-containing protein [Umezawaea sp. Da 62-37]
MLTMTTLPAAAQADASTGRFDRPHTGFAPPWTQLHRGNPGLDPAPIDAALDQVSRYTEPDATGHPMFAGAVTLLAHDGSVVAQRPTGWAVRYSDAKGTELPVEQQVPMAENTIFDLASISKLFTSIVVMQQVERGRVRVDQPVSKYLPEFGVNGKADITVEQLLTHTSGLEPWLPLWQQWPDVPSRIKAVMDATPKTAPGSAYTYSDLNLITLGELVRRVSGSPLDELVRKGITDPLGLPDTGYNPPASKLDRIAATEFESNPPRGMVRGQVHDENAWSLGGVAGHAGVFSTARDLAVLAQAILNGGTYDGHRILRPQTVKLMTTNFNTEFPEDSHGLGFELDQRWYMGALSSPATAGHTGFTGTTLVVDPMSRSIAILLTNRVHPSRDWGTINPARRAVADGLARALAVRPQQGRDAWTPTGATGATLTTGDLPGARKVSFDAFVDLDEGDSVVLQTGDGTTWRDVKSLTGTGTRKWTRVEAAIDGSRVRWVYLRGNGYGGRGVYLDGIRISGDRGTVLDAERHPEALTAVGWRAADR